MADVFMTVTGAGGKTGVDWANAYSVSEIQNAFDDLVAGETLYIEEGTYTLSATVDADTAAGTIASRITVVGVNSSHVEDGTIIIFDGNSAATYCLNMAQSYWSMRNIDLINATSHGANRGAAAAYWNFYNCGFNNNTQDGLVNANDTYQCAINCDFNGNGRRAILLAASYTKLADSRVMNNSETGLYNSYDLAVSNCIVHNNTTRGFYAHTSLIVNSIIDGNGKGIERGASLIAHSRITNNTTGIDATSGSIIEFDTFYYGNGTKHSAGTGIIQSFGDSIDGSSDGYTDRASDDFSLTSGAEGVEVQSEIGQLDSSNEGYITMGIPPQVVAGGSGGAFLVNGRLIK